MAANAQPIFVKTPRNESVKIITAAASADGVGSTLLMDAAAAEGSRVHAINALLAGTTATSTVLRLFLKYDTEYNIIAEVPIPAYTEAQGVPTNNINVLDYAYAGFLDPTDRFLTLEAGDALYVSVLNTIESDLHITAWGGDY